MRGIPGTSLVASCLARVRSLLRGVVHRETVESEMREELRIHVAMRTEDLIDRGLSRAEARRRAHLELGSMERHLEDARAARGLRPFDQARFSWIDVRLGLRMLVKHPALTLVAVFALAAGIPIGLAPIHLSKAVEAPLPEDPDDRVRSLRYWDPATIRSEQPTVDDLERWSDALGSFEALGAFRASRVNVVAGRETQAPVAAAEVTASVFDILATPPLLGRALDRADQAIGAPNVAVIGHDLWQSRFGADPAVIGRIVDVGPDTYAVVGVMPAGFLFPLRQQLWLPLRDRLAAPPGAAKEVHVLGRLAEGVSDPAAQAELAALGPPPADRLTEDRARLRPEVTPFAFTFIALPRSGLASMPEFFVFQALALALLLVACGNVAMLIFARTATRYRELAVRTALGASRMRIVSQLFAEALVLSLLATGVGLLAIDWILDRLPLAALAGESALPYWLRLEVTGEAVAGALALAVLCACVAGVIPALRITGTNVQRSIRQAETGRTGIRFGGVTSVLIVADVAIAIAVVGFVMAFADRMTDIASTEKLVGIPAEEYLAVEVRFSVGGLHGDHGEAERQRLGAMQRMLVERLGAEPGVRSVAVASKLPRMDHRSRLIEVEGLAFAERSGGRYVRVAEVDPGFFAALEQPILAGRGFDRSDLEIEPRPVVVNTVFVDRILGGGDPLGRRLRFVASRDGGPTPWHEVVGVVGHLGMDIVDPQGEAGFYLPAAPGELHPLRLGLHVGGPPERLVPRVRAVVAAVDPGAVLGSPRVLSSIYQGDWYLMIGIAGGLVVLVAILVLLATTGIYSIVSFSVSERTREIGIRTALGARRGTIVMTFVRRPLVQVAIGAALGMPFAGLLFHAFRHSAGLGSSPLLAVVVALGQATAVIAVIGLLSCVSPVRRALSIEASQALRSEG